LDHDLQFVQVDDIHRIDLFHMLHIVSQNGNHNHRAEAKIKKMMKIEINLILIILV
jgi:hypothetical protein